MRALPQASVVLAAVWLDRRCGSLARGLQAMTGTAGTHNGHLDGEAQARRRIKNDRRDRRVHPHGSMHDLDMPVPGAQRVVQSRLFRQGNRQSRGIGR